MTSERPFDRVGPALLGALAPLALLAVDPAGWHPFGPSKWLAVPVLGCAGAAATLATRPVRLPRPLGVALLLWLGWLAVAAAVGLDPVYAWIGTPERHLGVLTWVLSAALLAAGVAVARSAGVGAGRDDPERRLLTDGGVSSGVAAPLVTPLLWGMAFAGVGIGSVATAEALGWEPAVLDVGRRLTSTFGSAAYLGAATALLLPVLVGIAADPSMSRGVRRTSAVGVPLLAVACVGSGARAAWVGLAVSAAVAAAYHRTWVRHHARSVAAGAVVLAALVLLSPAGARITALGDADAAGGQGRVDEWRVAAQVALDHPLTGVGPEGYRIAFADGVDAAYEREHGRQQQPDRAHSGPLDVLLVAGLPGLAAWSVVVGLVGRHVLWALRAGPPWHRGVAAALVAHLAGQLLLFPLAELEPVAWLLAGVLVGAHPSSGDPPTSSVHEQPDNRIAVPVAARVAAAVLAGATVVALITGVTAVRADRRAGEAAEALARGDTRAAAEAAVDAAEQRPDVVRLHVLAAAAAVADDRGSVAGIRHLERALDVSPGDPIVLLARARLLVERAEATQVPAHIDAAGAELDRLLARDPYNGALWAASARLELLRGDTAAADRAAQRVEALDGAARW